MCCEFGVLEHKEGLFIHLAFALFLLLKENFVCFFRHSHWVDIVLRTCGIQTSHKIFYVNLPVLDGRSPDGMMPKACKFLF